MTADAAREGGDEQDDESSPGFRRLLWAKYLEVAHAIVERRAEMTPHGALLVSDLSDLAAVSGFKHLEIVEKKNCWDVYVRLAKIQFPETIPWYVNDATCTAWKLSTRSVLTAPQRAGGVIPRVWGSHRKVVVRSRPPVLNEVDWGFEVRKKGDEIEPYRVIMETELTGTLKEMTERLYEYMTSWKQVAVCVGVKLYEWREQTYDLHRRFVAVCVDLRRHPDTRLPHLRRIFNVGSCNANGDFHKNEIDDLLAWIDDKRKDNDMTSNHDATPDHRHYRGVERLRNEKYPLPDHDEENIDTHLLKKFYNIKVSGPELFYNCDLTEAHRAVIEDPTFPPFEINIYRMRLQWNHFADDWNPRIPDLNPSS